MRKIEDVARALDPSLWEAVDNGTEMPFARQISLDAARRAIEAMREPTQEMMAAAWTRQYENVGATPDEAVALAQEKLLNEQEVRFLKEGWGSAIDAALSEVKG